MLVTELSFSYKKKTIIVKSKHTAWKKLNPKIFREKYPVFLKLSKLLLVISEKSWNTSEWVLGFLEQLHL